MDPASPTIYRPPGYPFFLAAVFLIFGENIEAVLYVQAIIGALVGIPIYLLCRQHVPEQVARVTSAIVALYPHLSFYSATGLSETLLATVLVWFVYSSYRATGDERLLYPALAGFFSAFTILISPRFIAAPLIAVAAIWLAPNVIARGRKAGVCLGITIVLLIPWTFRNYVVFGLVNPAAVQSPAKQFWLAAERANLYDYSWVELRAREPLLRQHDALYADVAGERERMDERLQLEGKMYRDGIAAIREAPGAYIVDRLEKYPRLWIQPAMYAGYFKDPFEVQNKGLTAMVRDENWAATALRIASILLFVVLPVSSVILGMWVALPHWREHIPAYALFLWVAISHAPLWIEHRYSVVTHPVMGIFSAIGLWWFGLKKERKLKRRDAGATAH